MHHVLPFFQKPFKYINSLLQSEIRRLVGLFKMSKLKFALCLKICHNLENCNKDLASRALMSFPVTATEHNSLLTQGIFNLDYWTLDLNNTVREKVMIK